MKYPIGTDQDKYFQNIKLFEIAFPEFWERAYASKNNFFKYVFEEAKRQVLNLGISKEFLTDDHCKELWERHCDFCFEEITTDMNCACYCTEDGMSWICPECYKEHKDRYKWSVEKIEDIPDKGMIPLKVEIASEKE